MGNIRSVANCLDWLGASYRVTDHYADFDQAAGFILPGVGAFGAAMENLNRLDLVPGLTDQVRNRKKPFLGICLGMQLLALDSEELGYHRGLGWLDAHIVALHHDTPLRVPHVGWNNVEFSTSLPMFHNIEPGAHFYFDHSLHMKCAEAFVTARCDYGRPFAAAVALENIWAVQFHPEKSQRNGLKLMRNFLNFVEGSAS